VYGQYVEFNSISVFLGTICPWNLQTIAFAVTSQNMGVEQEAHGALVDGRRCHQEPVSSCPGAHPYSVPCALKSKGPRLGAGPAQDSAIRSQTQGAVYLARWRNTVV
jgi:hypothetical protein